MGFNNPDVPWSELERTLSDRPAPRRDPRHEKPTHVEGDGSDSPAWSYHRPAYSAPQGFTRRRGSVPYAELHCHSNFSFLDGASHPEALAEEAARLGLEALALTDHDGFYGVVRFAEAARAVELPTVFGAELSLGLTRPQNGVPDPEGSHLLVLARGPAGYARLADTISTAQLAGQLKGKPVYDSIDWSRAHGDDWVVLTGCRKGAVNRALVDHGPAAAERELRHLIEVFGVDNVVIELWDHHDPLDSARNDALAALAARVGVRVVATNNVHYATPAERPLATALAAVRARDDLDGADGWLPPAATAHLRSGAEQARRFARYPGAVERAAELGQECAFDLQLVAPNLPPFPCPLGPDGVPLSEMAYLRRLTEVGAEHRYGPRTRPTVPGAWEQIDHELALIETLGFPGYFLIVWDLVDFCRRADIYCQGRGSAANSAVCYALGITNADAVTLGLLFERFLSPERDGPPDIDIDIESNRREEVIQYVYERHGRRHAAQVANVITYRAKSSVRDMAKALGYATGQQDAFATSTDAWGSVATTASQEESSIPPDVLEMAGSVEHFPRHLGVHSGGMVLCDRPVVEVCPVEWARFTGREGSSWRTNRRPDVAESEPSASADGSPSGSRAREAELASRPQQHGSVRSELPIRSVLQWDKDDCAAAGLVKFDLLGLGILTALHETVDLVRDAYGFDLELATIPQDDEVYEMLCNADSVGVFQVESRAQMATLPRLAPRTFYDLVVEVALIRPGPIQGGSVHPYIRRRNGQEEVTYLHPLLEKSLAKTLGIPLFQEQLMQMAMDVGGFAPAESDQLRQAMGSKRSPERMGQLHGRFREGARERGVPDDVIEQIWVKLAAFANYGFPESHSVSFAYLVYASSWFKRFFPAAFCAGLLNAQPMGFWSPHSLIQDARRHGVEVRSVDLNASARNATLTWPDTSPDPGPDPDPGDERADRRVRPTGTRERAEPSPVESPEVTTRGLPPDAWGRGGPVVQLGFREVRGIGIDLATGIAVERDANGPYASMEDLARRVELSLPQLEALATAGAFGCLSSPVSGARLGRREAIWQAGAVAQGSVDRLPGIVTGGRAPALPGMDDFETARADLWATGMSAEGHPTRFIRDELDRMGVVTSAGLWDVEPGAKVLIGGVVTHRQRPATAGGTMFLNVEDETGLVNVVVSKGCWKAHRRVALTAPAMLIRGRCERSEGVINVVAEKLSFLPIGGATPKSRDFR
ncbi:MAG: error-prone DNA polymerase [Acidimicrobiales bacterium]|nr:error-prone DNA polymerase [Acidimicrobiales bacterium]